VSYSLKVVDGDLVQQGSELAIVSGQEKLYQDMSLWLRERYGVDRSHPNYGSRLPDFIGGVIESHTRVRVYNEVLRILNNYQNMQTAHFTANPSKFSVAELMASIDDVTIDINYDTVNVTVRVSNPAGGTSVAISAGV
jgi:hypothetical protein